MIKLRIRARGLGLVEVMVAVAVMGVLAAVAIPSMLDLLERRRVVAVGLEVANVFNFAKSQALSSGDVITVHLEKDPAEAVSCASVNVQSLVDPCKCYRPAAEMCGKAKVDVLRLFQLQNKDGVSFVATATSWGDKAERVNFARNKPALETADIQVNVKGRRTGAQLRVELNHANRVRVCTPHSSISGFPTC
jgi:type IV fimbrial biogenesis protein FimT